MEYRSLGKFIAFSLLTLGIYTIFWSFWTTKELNNKGANIPTPWLLFIPIANLYFMWKYYEGAEMVTGGAVNAILYFVLALFISPIISDALAQNEYNKLSTAAPAPGMGAMPQQGMPQQPMQQPMAQAPAAPEAPVAEQPPQDPNQQPPAPTV